MIISRLARARRANAGSQNKLLTATEHCLASVAVLEQPGTRPKMFRERSGR